MHLALRGERDRRRPRTLAATMSDYLQKELAATKNVWVRLDTEVVDGGGDLSLEHVELRRRSSGDTERLAALVCSS